MSRTAKLLAVLGLGAALLVAGAAIAGRGARPERRATPGSAAAGSARESAAPLAGRPLAPPAAREPAAAPTAPTPTAAAPARPAAPASPLPTGPLLDGRVVDEAGTPIGGAELRVTGAPVWSDRARDAAPSLVATSSADGTLEARLALDGLGVGELGAPAFSALPAIGTLLRLEVAASGFATASLVVRLGGPEVHLGTIVLAPGIELSGRVLDPAGAPVAGAEVRWIPEHYWPRDPERAREEGVWRGDLPDHDLVTQADEAGLYRLAGVPASRGFLLGRGPGTAYGWTEPFDPPAEGVLGIDLVLPPVASDVAIGGRVLRPDGSPAAHALVRSLPEGEPASGMHVRADAEGRFLFTPRDASPCRVQAFDAEERARPAEAGGVAPGTLDLVLRLGEPEWLEVVLADASADGAPIPWGWVRGFADGRLEGAIPMTQADHAGSLRVPRPLGQLRLEAFAPGFRTQRFGPFDPARLGRRLVLSLERGQAVTGRVVHRGRPVAGARLGLALTQPPGSLAWSASAAPLDSPFVVLGTAKLSGHDATSDEDGAFVATLHASGRTSVHVVAEGFPPTTFGPFVWSTMHGATDVVLELERGGAIEGRVLAGGAALGGRLVGASNGWGYVVSTRTDGEGRFRLEDLQPGPWQVRPCAPPLAAVEALALRRSPRPWEPGAPSSSDPSVPVWDCEVRPARATRFDLDLSDHEAFVLEGELASGWDVAGWSAELRAPGEGEERVLGSDTLDRHGRFRIAISRGGPLRLVVTGELVILDQELHLERGTNPWRAEVPTGRLLLAGTPPRNEDGSPLPVLLYFREDPRGLAIERPLYLIELFTSPDPLPFELPLGRGRIVTRDPRRADAPERTLLEIDLVGGEELLVELP